MTTMIRVSIVDKFNQTVAQGQVGMCHNAGAALDALLRCGHALVLEQFDTDIDPIEDEMRTTFTHLVNASIAESDAP